MTKLDWSRAGVQSADPARVQRVADFVEPDQVETIVPWTPAEAAALQAMHERDVRIAEKKRAAKFVALKAARKRKRATEKVKRAAEAEEQKLAVARASAREERLKELEIREAAKMARKPSPQQLATQEAKEKRLAATEQRRVAALRREREPLRQLWREKLLKPPEV